MADRRTGSPNQPRVRGGKPRRGSDGGGRAPGQGFLLLAPGARRAVGPDGRTTAVDRGLDRRHLVCARATRLTDRVAIARYNADTFQATAAGHGAAAERLLT